MNLVRLTLTKPSEFRSDPELLCLKSAMSNIQFFKDVEEHKGSNLLNQIFKKLKY
jgi:hypothetical protein